jgi:hypothetical protein
MLKRINQLILARLYAFIGGETIVVRINQYRNSAQKNNFSLFWPNK